MTLWDAIIVLVKRSLYDWGGLLAWALVAAIALFVATKPLWFDHLQPGEKALFWTNVSVAAGTLALAVVTVASVLQTKGVLRSEDRRHQQGYAPFLTLGDHLNNHEEFENGYVLRNRGDGIALNITFEVRGRATVASFDFPTGPPSGMLSTIEEQEAYREKYKTLNVYELFDLESLSASFPGGYDEFFQEIMRHPPGKLPELEDVTYSLCCIQYSDIFGNRYETRYIDDRLDRFKWIQPESLQVPK